MSPICCPKAAMNYLCKEKLESDVPVSVLILNECSAGALPVASQLEFLLCVNASSVGQNATCS